MGVTSNGLPYPENSDFVADGAMAIKDLAENVDGKAGLWKVIPSGATNGTVGANGDVTIGSAVSSVTVSGAFSSKYANYKIIINGGVGSTTTDLTLKLGATVTGYYTNVIFMSYNSNTVNGLGQTNQGSWAFAGAMTANSLHLNVDIFQPQTAKRTTYTANHAFSTLTTGLYVSGGNLDNATQYTSFIIAPASGTMTGGVIKVFGYN
jgi:hypothetical protein